MRISLLMAFCWATAGMLWSAQPSVVGRLCFTGNECRDSSCGDRVEPTGDRRLFTLTAATEGEYVLGILEPGDTTVPCAGYGSFALRIPTKLPRRATVRVSVSDEKEKRWDLRLSEAQVNKPLILRLPLGRYQLMVETAHFVRYTQGIEAADVLHSAFVTLKPLPALEGIIIDTETKGPVFGALIKGDTVGEALSDPTGRFMLAADPEKWPNTVAVSAAGYAETAAVVPAARVSARLEPIRLSRGGRIVMELGQSALDRVTEIELLRVTNRGRSIGATVRTLSIAKEEAVLRVANLEPGPYLILAKGNQKCERLAERVEVRPAQEARLSIDIHPFHLRVRTELEGQPLGNADVTLRNRDDLWAATLTTDSGGEATAELWQAGNYTCTVKAKGLYPYVERRALTADDADLLLQIPPRQISGVVTDAKSGEPIAGAGVSLHVESDDGYSLSATTKTDRDGYFTFEPVAYGRHRLSAAAADHSLATMTYSFREPEQSRTVTLALDPAAVTQLTVVDGRGNPVGGARVMEFIGLTDRRTGGLTDGSGTMKVPLSEGETVDVYVIPRDGSFGFARLQGGTSTASVRIADGVSRIVLRAESESHVPIPNISVAMRYNSQVVPLEVVWALGTIQGSRIRADSDGRIVFDHMPPGLYEFWLGGSPREMRSLLMGGRAEPPVSMAVSPGENVATLTFGRAAP